MSTVLRDQPCGCNSLGKRDVWTQGPAAGRDTARGTPRSVASSTRQQRRQKLHRALRLARSGGGGHHTRGTVELTPTSRATLGENRPATVEVSQQNRGAGDTHQKENRQPSHGILQQQ